MGTAELLQNQKKVIAYQSRPEVLRVVFKHQFLCPNHAVGGVSQWRGGYKLAFHDADTDFLARMSVSASWNASYTDHVCEIVDSWQALVDDELEGDGGEQ